MLNYFLSNLWKTLANSHTTPTLWNQDGFVVSFAENTPSHNLQTSQQMSQGHLTKLYLHYFTFKITCILFSVTIYSCLRQRAHSLTFINIRSENNENTSKRSQHTNPTYNHNHVYKICIHKPSKH